MSVIVNRPEPNLWEEICKEFASQRPPFDDDDVADDTESVTTDYDDFNPSQHNPVFYGKMYARIDTDADVYTDFDSSIAHPSCVGYSFTTKPTTISLPPAVMPPNRFVCSSTEYLNYYIFPWLLPALEAMLNQAKIEKCFEEEKPDQEDHRRRTKFNACDFITEYLYKNNPSAGQEDRKNLEFSDIPFVKEWLKDHSRPPLPKSLIWTDEEAAIIIQSFWRGYLVRRQEDVREMRAWQKEWREENRGIQNRVSEFWNKQMPSVDDTATVISESLVDSVNEEGQKL